MKSNPLLFGRALRVILVSSAGPTANAESVRNATDHDGSALYAEVGTNGVSLKYAPSREIDIAHQMSFMPSSA